MLHNVMVGAQGAAEQRFTEIIAGALRSHPHSIVELQKLHENAVGIALAVWRSNSALAKDEQEYRQYEVSPACLWAFPANTRSVHLDGSIQISSYHHKVSSKVFLFLVIRNRYRIEIRGSPQ